MHVIVFTIFSSHILPIIYTY